MLEYIEFLIKTWSGKVENNTDTGSVNMVCYNGVISLGCQQNISMPTMPHIHIKTKEYQDIINTYILGTKCLIWSPIQIYIKIKKLVKFVHILQKNYKYLKLCYFHSQNICHVIEEIYEFIYFIEFINMHINVSNKKVTKNYYKINYIYE